MSESKQLVCFFVGSDQYGINVTKVQEVLECQQATEVPLADSQIIGLINLRGSIITTLDLRKILDVKGSYDTGEEKHIIIQTEDELLSLAVDRVGEVVEVVDDQFENIPPTISERLTKHLSGVYKFRDQLILELNVSTLDEKEHKSSCS